MEITAPTDAPAHQTEDVFIVTAIEYKQAGDVRAWTSPDPCT